MFYAITTTKKVYKRRLNSNIKRRQKNSTNDFSKKYSAFIGITVISYLIIVTNQNCI